MFDADTKERFVSEHKFNLHPLAFKLRYAKIPLGVMLPRRHLQLVVTILVAMSIIAFTQRLQRPHVRLSCGSIEATTLSGPQRFTNDSSRLPDLKTGYEADVVPLPRDLKLISDDEAATLSLSFRFKTPSVRPIVRRYKLLRSRAESQDPL